jgi:ketosteroid isomerase-like protein
MKTRYALNAIVLAALAAGSARAEDLRAVMEADNARWLAAFNTNTPATLAAMYTKDAVVLAPGPAGTEPANGRLAIGKFWEDVLKPGDRKDHTWEIVSVQQDGQYAWQVARLTLNVRNKSGGFTNVSGNTLRIFERQPDGTWLTKVHIFNRHQ